MPDLTITLDGEPIPVYLGDNASLALAAAERAETAADTAEAALASIIADPDVSALATTALINLNDRVVVYRGGVPLLFNGVIPRIGAQGTLFAGDTPLTGSTDPSARIGRDITITPLGSPHGLALEDRLAWGTNGLSYSGLDVRTVKSGSQSMGHIGGGQSGLSVTGAGTVDEALHWIADLAISAGTVTENIAVHFPAPDITGTGAVGASIGLNMPDMPEHNGVPGVPNYWVRAVGGARGYSGGQFTSNKFFSSPSEGVAGDMFHAATASGTAVYLQLQQLSNNVAKIGFAASSIDLDFIVNVTKRLTIQNAGHVLPGGDNTQNLGSGSFRFGTVYAGTGAINTSDGREKVQIGSIPAKWLDAWGEVEWVRFKFAEAVARAKDKDDPKGAARWHVGLVAQQVHAAFEQHGLDAFKIGLCCYDQWDAREEVRIVADKDGNAILDADGQEQTETVTIPAGDRWGLRYSECEAMEAAWLRRQIQSAGKAKS